MDGMPLRKNYAGPGYTYDYTRDAFIPPKPYVGWVLDETSCIWAPPFPRPIDDKYYGWNNSTSNWAELPPKPQG